MVITVRQRLFRQFVRAGGDLADAAEVAEFLRYVEAHFVLLPTKLRTAMEAVWGESEPPSYSRIVEQLSHTEGQELTIAAVRQRLSRGMRLLERAIQTRRWRRHTRSVGHSGGVIRPRNIRRRRGRSHAVRSPKGK